MIFYWCFLMVESKLFWSGAFFIYWWFFEDRWRFLTFWGAFIKPTPTFLQKIKLPFYYLGDSFQDIGDFSCSLFYFLPAYLSKAQYQFRTKTQINLKTPKKPQGDNTLYQRSNPTPPYTYTPSYYSLSNSIKYITTPLSNINI